MFAGYNLLPDDLVQEILLQFKIISQFAHLEPSIVVNISCIHHVYHISRVLLHLHNKRFCLVYLYKLPGYSTFQFLSTWQHLSYLLVTTWLRLVTC